MYNSYKISEVLKTDYMYSHINKKNRICLIKILSTSEKMKGLEIIISN